MEDRNLFRVIDTKTGKEADTYEIALNEDWAKSLIYCDMEGFAIEEDGTLVLEDECGNYVYCPEGRFYLEWDKPWIQQKTGRWIKMSDADGTYYCCSECGEELYREWSFDPQFNLFPRKTSSIAKTKYCSCCGARMEGEQDG